MNRCPIPTPQKFASSAKMKPCGRPASVTRANVPTDVGMTITAVCLTHACELAAWNVANKTSVSYEEREFEDARFAYLTAGHDLDAIAWIDDFEKLAASREKNRKAASERPKKSEPFDMGERPTHYSLAAMEKYGIAVPVDPNLVTRGEILGASRLMIPFKIDGRDAFMVAS